MHCPPLRARDLERIAVVALVGTLALLLLLPPVGSGGSPAPPAPQPSRSGAAPYETPTAAAERPAVHALNLSLSYDWDGMGYVGGNGIPTSRVGGEGAALAIDDVLRTGVLFGGEGPLGLTNVSLALNETSAVWRDVTQPLAPSPRANFSFGSDPLTGFAVLFGGVTSLRTQQCDNQTWVYWFSNATWVNETRPVAPPPREGGAFAIDAFNATAVLEGGTDPAYRAGGATGTVVWNDTWTLDLATFNWTERHPAVSPSPYFGSSIAWVPPVHSFLMFGGCFTGCTNAMWSYVPGGNWTVVRPNGTAPPGRAAATFAWGPDYGLLAMFGGFSLQGQTMEAHNDTYVYQPIPRAWSWVQGPPDPFHRYGAPGAWLSANQCPGLFLIGGSTAVFSSPPDQWFMDSNPDTQPGCNTWGSDQVGNTSGGGGGNGTLPPGCVANADVSVHVLSAATGAEVRNATVALRGYCGPYSRTTDAFGYANFTNVPSWATDLLVTATGYHSNSTVSNFTPLATTHLTIRLSPLPRLVLRTVGVDLGGVPVDLVGVPIWIDGAPTANVSGPGGWWNASQVSLPIGLNTFSAERVGYSVPSVTVFFPYTGTVWVNLTLYQIGPFTVTVRIAGTDLSVPGASGEIVPLDADATGGRVPFTVPLSGSLTFDLPQGNYSVTAGAAGFLPNVSSGPVFHPWANATVVQINLTPLTPFTLVVRLLDSVIHLPIPNGTVILGSSDVNVTNPGGWANFTRISPAGTYGVLGAASGYLGNRTTVDFAYDGSPVVHLELNLTPLHPCPEGGCGQPSNGTSSPVFALVPPGFWGLAFLTTSPLLLLVGAVAYLAGARRRTGAEARA